MRLKTKPIALVSLLALICIISMFPSTIAQPTPQRGPQIDVLRQTVVKGLDAVLFDLIGCKLDMAPDLIRPTDIETLDDAGFTITSAPGFHMGHIGFNIRPDQTYRPGGASLENKLKGKVLSDVKFRKALFQCYDQETIVASIYKYIVTPVRSLVPPAQGGWVNPGVPRIAYNPGDPATHEAGTACGTLYDAGYRYDGDSWLTPEAWGTELGGQEIPDLHCFTPTYEVAATSAEHGARWVASCNAIGLTSIIHEPAEFSPYLAKVFGEADFDMYMVFWGLGRFPDHLYDMCHSSQDCALHPWRYNAPGINDPELDPLLETVKFSLDHDAKMAAAWEIQRRLYDENYPLCAFAYMQLYSRVYFCAFKAGLRGIVNSPGYGADNSWTYLNVHWESGDPNERIEAGPDGILGTEDDVSVVIYQLGEEPELLNPCYAHTVYAWNIIGSTMDGLIAVNPYTHEDTAWLAESWKTENFTGTVTLDSDWWTTDGETYTLYKAENDTYDITNGMVVTFNLNGTAYWQDGNLYTPDDAEFNLEFLRNNAIPRYTSMWEHLVDVQVINSTAFKVYVEVTSQWLMYDFAGDAAILAPPVWEPLDLTGHTNILGYDPSEEVGPQPDPTLPYYCPTKLYGTGPFIFVKYWPVEMYTDMPANRYYFKSTNETQAMKVEMFHSCGDVNRDGEVWGADKTRYSLAYGCRCVDDCYDADADITGPEGVPDCLVDAWDGVLISFFWGDQREYP